MNKLEEPFETGVTYGRVLREIDGRLSVLNASLWSVIASTSKSEATSLLLAREYILGARRTAALLAIRSGAVTLLLSTLVSAILGFPALRDLRDFGGVVSAVIPATLVATFVYTWFPNRALDTMHRVADEIRNAHASIDRASLA